MVELKPGLTREEEDHLIALHHKMGITWSPRVFRSITPRVALCTVEVVCLREKDDRLRVLLIQRPADDPDWPNQWHSPGTAVRASDGYRAEDPRVRPDGNGLDRVFRRLEEVELGVKFARLPQLVDYICHSTVRGTHPAPIFIGELAGEPKHGKWFDVDHLPENLIDCHHWIIATAVQAYPHHM